MDEAESLRLLRAFEPVVRLTQGEYFVPTGVDGYVSNCSLWLVEPSGESRRVAEPGTLDLERLAAFGRERDAPGYSLSAVEVPHRRRDRIRSWFKTERPHFRAGHRLAEVGLTGRAIDALSRVSLLLRGSVPGGSAVASLAIQNAALDPENPRYHGRVVSYGGWIICQYWFFYAFNNWRSGFSGVNEHEADWEQVTVYLDGTGERDVDGLPIPRWVVFSAHDEVGDDLRRRWDDPDLGVVDGRHPVVYAGAGSHSGAYLPGDYLISIVPPTLGGIVPLVRRLAKILTPWARAAQGSGLGIPYIDYARGDGIAVGPGADRAWTPVLIDDHTPWVRDYRGLWGHDTRDRLGGERGPAGPRYDRDGTVRASWGDPLGWAGLAKVAPNPEAERALIAQRLVEIDAEVSRIDAEVTAGTVSVAERAAGLAPDAPEVRALESEEARLTAARLDAVKLLDERTKMERALSDGIPAADPHAHLRHRRLPLAEGERRRSRLLSAWSVISTPLILLLLASMFWPADFSRPVVALWVLLAILGVEALARGYFLAYLWRLIAIVVIINFVLVYAFNWQWITTWVLAALAVIVLIVNIRDVRRH